MLHGNEGSTQGGKLCVCQVAVDMKDEALTENTPNPMDQEKSREEEELWGLLGWC